MPSFCSLSGVSGFGAPSSVRISNYNRPSQGRNPTEILAMVCSKTCGYFCSPCTWIPTQVQSSIVLNWVISTNYGEARENPGARSQQRSYSKLTLSTSVLQGLALKKEKPFVFYRHFSSQLCQPLLGSTLQRTAQLQANVCRMSKSPLYLWT